jgi:hypothetical protein
MYCSLLFNVLSYLLVFISMSYKGMPPESVFPGYRGMPPESDFPGIFFHHPDHRSYWQRLHIWERATIIIFSVVFIAAIFYRVIFPRIIQLWDWWHSQQATSHVMEPLPAIIELPPPPV